MQKLIWKMQADPWHFLSCNRHSAAWNRRHRWVCEAVAAWVRHLGGTCKLEPTQLDQRDRSRPDGDIVFGGTRLLFDVSITHPLADSYRSNAAKLVLATAAKREQEKRSKYAPMAAAQHARFFPVVLESTGGCGKEAALFFKEVVRASKAARGSWCPKDVVYGVARDVAIAVQRGNNAIVGSAFLMPRV